LDESSVVTEGPAADEVRTPPGRALSLIPWVPAAAKRGLDRQHVVLLLLLSAAAFFDGYDTSIKSLALTQIRESFDLSKAGASALLAVVFLGALPAMAITRWADRVGRRRMLLVSVLGYTLFSGLTALAPNAATYATLQFCQQVFLVAEGALVWTMAAEELPADARGFGFGILGMNIALGTGFAAILYGGVFDPAGISWRWLYVVGVPPLLLVAVLRRKLPESRRFSAAQAASRLAGSWREILRPPYGRWLMLVVVTTFLLQLSTQAATFAIDYLQTDRGIDTSTANGMLVLAGLPGIPLMVAAGGLSDRFGRRVVGCSLALASMVGGLILFWAPGGIPVLLPAMSLTLVGTMGSFPVIQTYATELFPTSLRGSASSWSATAGVLGRTASLGIAAVLLTLTNEHQSITATVLGIGPLVAVIMIAVLFPDTHGRELEDTSGEPPVDLVDPAPHIPAGPGAPPEDEGAGLAGALP
jgi:MFS transporter, putative metabolite:H+ symporter